MRTDHHLPDQSPGADPVITTALRDTYAPPTDAAYWQGLHERVMARLGETPVVAWWNVLSEWRMIGAVAAAEGPLPEALEYVIAAPEVDQPSGSGESPRR